MSGWLEVRALLEKAPEDWSLLAHIFDRHGCPGSIQEDDPPTLTGYLAAVPAATERARQLQSDLEAAGARIEIQTIPEQDWSELWKIHFKPRRIGKRFVIRPTWEPFESAGDDLTIVLDPGQAFGTGDHPTTRLCLELMDYLELAGKSVADIGCGSGVLSIGAKLLGAGSVIGSDIDPISVEVAIQNARLNMVEATFREAEGMAWLPEPVDVLLSNIISATLIRMAPDAARAVRTGGIWIVSGIIRANWPDVEAAAARSGFKLERIADEDDWVAATFCRGS